MMLELFSGLLISVSGFIFGIYKSELLKHRVEICCQTEDLLRTSLNTVRYQRLDVYELVDYLQQCRRFSTFSFLDDLSSTYQFNSSFRDEWNKSVSESALPKENVNLLIRFGEIIGASDIEGQKNSITALENEAEILTAQCREDYLKKGKLYRSLGLLVGLMAAIVLM